MITNAADSESIHLQIEHTFEQLKLDGFTVLHLCQNRHHTFAEAPRGLEKYRCDLTYRLLLPTDKTSGLAVKYQLPGILLQ
jgi:hypothetical protein